MAFDADNYWFSWFPHRFRAKTLHLTLEQDGAYRRLIDEYMITRRPLPDNDVALARVLGASVEHWSSIRPALIQFFEVHSGKLVHGRCEEELHEQDVLSEKRKENARHAAEARWSGPRAVRAPRMRRASSPDAQAMLENATKQNTLTTSEPVAARGQAEDATAPAVEAPPEGHQKRPCDLTRAELDAVLAKKKAPPPPKPAAVEDLDKSPEERRSA